MLLLADPVVIEGVDVTDWTTDRLWQEADRHWHAGNYPAAVQIEDRIIALDPTDIEAYTVSAWLVWSMGDEPRARDYLVRCVKANPETWESHFELGYHLFDRCGDAEAAIPHLAAALRYPPYPANVERALAHAYRWAEQPSRAVAFWRQLAAAGRTPQGIIDINLPIALAEALRSDMQARCGGVISGAPSPDESPIALRDERSDTDGDGLPDVRVLDLDDPTDRDGVPDYRIRYVGRPVVHKVAWRWTEMVADIDGDGSFDDEEALRDEDGDGIAESLPSIAALAAERTRLTGCRRRFLAPDRYEVGVGAHGHPAPLWSRLRDGRLELEPQFYVATDRIGVELRLGLKNVESREVQWVRRIALPPGVYAGRIGVGAGPLRVEMDPAEIAPGRYWFVTALYYDVAPLDTKIEPAEILEVGPAHEPALVVPTAEEVSTRDLPPEPPADEPPPGLARPPVQRGG